MKQFSKEINYLKNIGTDKLPHSNRTLLDHLIGTANLLKELGRTEIEQKAGLFHSIYGTEYYKHSKKLKVEREEIINLIGNECEKLVHVFCNLNNRTRTILLKEDFEEPLKTQLLWLEYANIKEQQPNSPFLEKFEQILNINKIDDVKIENYVPILNTFPIFSIPIGVVNFGEKVRELNEKLIQEMELEKNNNINCQRTFSGNDSSWQSELGMEKKYEGFQKLKKVINEVAINFLVESLFLEKQYANKIITHNLWGNIIYNMGGWSQPHTHGDGTTLFTGVYYPKSENSDLLNLNKFDKTKVLIVGNIITEDGVLVLKDPSVVVKRMSRSNYFYNKIHQGGNIYIRPREGLLVLFPAWLEHFVTPVMDFKEKRYSISFAINIEE